MSKTIKKHKFITGKGGVKIMIKRLIRVNGVIMDYWIL